MSRGIYKMCIISWKQKCHRNYYFGAEILSIVPLNLLEKNLACILLSILTNYNLSLYIKCRFLEICLSFFVIFHWYGDINIAGEGCKFWPMLARHSWPLSSEGSSDVHIYCRALSNGAVNTCFYDIGLSRLGFEHQTFRLPGERLGWLCTK